MYFYGSQIYEQCVIAITTPIIKVEGVSVNSTLRHWLNIITSKCSSVQYKCNKLSWVATLSLFVVEGKAKPRREDLSIKTDN